MSFVLKMVWRETRTSWLRLGFFFLCVGLGVAAIVVLRSIVQDVRLTLTGEARSIIAADVVVQSQQPLTGAVRDRIDAAIAAVPGAGTTEVLETQTMASVPVTGDAVKLVEVRGVEAAYPYYGTIELEGGQPYSHALLEHHGMLVPPELLVALGVHQGDTLRMAGQAFTIRGVITRDRVQRGGFAFGPRVYVDLADLRATSLFGYGSRATYALLVRTGAAETARLTTALKAVANDALISVQSWQTLEDRIGENLRVAENYLSLVGFVVVVLGGIGVWSVTRVIVQQKIRSVAILKCIGATSGRVLATYVLQVVLLATGGSILGIGLAAVALRALPASLLTPIGLTHVNATVPAALQGLAVGLLVSLLFALVPLLEIRRVKPLLLLRADTVSTARVRGWQSWAAGLVIAGALAGVAMWQADSVRAGAYVSLGLAVVAAVLYASGRLLVLAVRPLTASPAFALRHAVISLGRPGNQTRVVLMAVGLGCFFVLGIRAIQANLLHEIAAELGDQTPDFVLVDIQPDEIGAVQHAIAPYLRSPARIVPLLRGRVVRIDGQHLHLDTLEQIRHQGRLSREFGLTFRTALEPNEHIEHGRFWSSPLTSMHLPDGADTEVSIATDVPDTEGIEIGDLIRFDVAGRQIAARVTSLRSVSWGDAQNGGFVFVLRPGPAVEQTAHDFLGFVQVRDDPAARGGLQRDVVHAASNVSVIDVRDVLTSIREVVANITLGITVVGVVTLVGGALILIGAVAMTKFQRLYESAIYRTLGASTRIISTMVAIEYGVLGGLAGVLGALGALAASWAVARYLFDMPWDPAPGLLGAGVLIAAAAVTAVGLLASLDVLFTKPLATLKGE
jgi:putative ABC transport system permease protein